MNRSFEERILVSSLIIMVILLVAMVVPEMIGTVIDSWVTLLSRWR
jgi:hypothetical protein